MKKVMGWASALLAPVAVFAQASGANPYEESIDFEKAGQAADAIGKGVKELIEGSVMSNVLLVVGAALAVWAVFLVIRWIRRAGR